VVEVEVEVRVGANSKVAHAELQPHARRIEGAYKRVYALEAMIMSVVCPALTHKGPVHRVMETMERLWYNKCHRKL